ncbi:hypothetical protein BDZ89DRAFT_380585 [Hymenopellis radicata]|nr:hypothetical protein BDZ89DRAFT_380585 [Hymenopellis radicata]
MFTRMLSSLALHSGRRLFSIWDCSVASTGLSVTTTAVSKHAEDRFNLGYMNAVDLRAPGYSDLTVDFPNLRHVPQLRVFLPHVSRHLAANEHPNEHPPVQSIDLCEPPPEDEEECSPYSLNLARREKMTRRVSSEGDALDEDITPRWHTPNEDFNIL